MTITRIIKGPYRFAGFFWVDVECDGKVQAAGQRHCCWAGGGMTHFIRKRDGKRYTCDLIPRAWPGFSRRGPSYLLKPVWEGRTHYKTVAAFEREFPRVV